MPSHGSLSPTANRRVCNPCFTKPIGGFISCIVSWSAPWTPTASTWGAAVQQRLLFNSCSWSWGHVLWKAPLSQLPPCFLAAALCQFAHHHQKLRKGRFVVPLALHLVLRALHSIRRKRTSMYCVSWREIKATSHCMNSTGYALNIILYVSVAQRAVSDPCSHWPQSHNIAT